MGDFLPSQANVLNQPTKPPDLAPSVLGHASPAIPNPHTGHTPPQSGLTLPNNPQLAKTLGLAPSIAAAPSNSDPPTGQSPTDAPPLDDLLGGSIAPQQLAHAVLQSGASRVPLSVSLGPLAASRPPSISGTPNPASFIPPQLIAPRMAQNPNPLAD
ncbi:hypothetical protein Fot_37601 [Forsythia ovata]|uniref:Uncharacterized protein n=1 Tax=Forsythia ovata TaxID=205694 RepID=A0ABD1S0W6_9LAMI